MISCDFGPQLAISSKQEAGVSKVRVRHKPRRTSSADLIADLQGNAVMTRLDFLDRSQGDDCLNSWDAVLKWRSESLEQIVAGASNNDSHPPQETSNILGASIPRNETVHIGVEVSVDEPIATPCRPGSRHTPSVSGNYPYGRSGVITPVATGCAGRAPQMTMGSSRPANIRFRPHDKDGFAERRGAIGEQTGLHPASRR